VFRFVYIDGVRVCRGRNRAKDRSCLHGEQVLLLASPAATPNNPTTPAPLTASASPCMEIRQEVEDGRSYANTSITFWRRLLRYMRC